MKHYTDNSRMCAAILYFIAMLFLMSSNAYSESRTPLGTDQFKVIKGMAIYIGILPAEILEGHINNKTIHGGLPLGPIRFHLTVAIFNDKTGKRINDANVTAQIFTIPEKTGFKKLELMELGETTVYGNYFSMKALGPYLIQLHITHKQLKEPIDVEFQHQAAYARFWHNDNSGK